MKQTTNKPEVLLFDIEPPRSYEVRAKLVDYLTKQARPVLSEEDSIRIEGQRYGKALIQFTLVTIADFDEIAQIINQDEP